MTCAYYLAKQGHEVSVIEGNSGVALEASFANGGQLSYSYVEPLASPGALPKIPLWLFGRDSPLRFRPKMDPHQWRWCWEFLRACTREQNRAATAHLLRLAFYSRDLMQELVTQEALDFDYAKQGKLVIYADPPSFSAAVEQMEYQKTLGCEQEALDADQCVECEPALAHAKKDIHGGIYTAGEYAGDCQRFCSGLQTILRSGPYRVNFLFNTWISDFAAEGETIRAVRTSAGDIEGDAFVLALGAPSYQLSRKIGIRLSIYPLKGYSITLSTEGHGGAPRVSITDSKRKVVYARLGERLRVAGMVELVGYDREIDQRRVAELVNATREIFPGCADFTQVKPWSGFRPATPTSLPILGKTRFRNLYLDAGKGTLGFTLACASGRIVADLVSGKQPEIDITPFSAC